MSGIYIKSMEMPTSCGFCLFEKHTDDGYECCINGCLTEYQKRPDDCPLVPVPPHGRLIDADELDAAIRDEMDECGWDNASFVGYRVWGRVDEAPTIIPAEEGET